MKALPYLYMQTKVFHTVEFDKILEICKTHTASQIGAERVMSVSPASELSRANLLLAETAEADAIYRRTGRTPVNGFPDIRDNLCRIHAAYALSMSELLDAAVCLKASRVAKETVQSDEPASRLQLFANRLCSLRHIEDEIARCILSEDEMSDNASPELNRLRRQMRLTNERVRDKLNSYIKSPTYQKYLQDPIITMRNGRYAIPVKAECRGQIDGLIHDQSGSGQTLFIEPAAIVELGNEYKRLLAEERREIERILAGLTALLAPEADALCDSLTVLGELDAIFARAIMARDMHAYLPRLNDESRIHIKNGRHPLLDVQTAAPITLWIGTDFDSLIITGPNTGGKTVTLKTVGLFTLMAMSGMFVPAEEGSELSVFDEVYADIGDEQSIEQSLSTFSSHMKNLVSILQHADAHTLVLLDELGAGTDPLEGAALAQAILEHLQRTGATTLATTHYSEIKAFALSRARMQNASMEFDVDRLCPTYHLYIGIPGKSNAFEISERLGLDAAVIDRARQFLKKEDLAFEDVLAGAETQRRQAEQLRLSAEEEHAQANALRQQLEKEKMKLEEDKAQLKQKAREDARAVVNETKREMEALITELRAIKDIDTKALERAIQQSRDAMRLTEDKLYQSVEKRETYGLPPQSVKTGQTVQVISINGTATVLKPQDAKGMVQVQAGIIKMSVPLSDIRSVKEEKRSDKPKGAGKEILQNVQSVGLELNLRGMTVDDAILEIDRYIDACRLAGMTEVNLIHGKGTGALRAGVQQYLKSHPKVASFRLGNYGEGDAGVTVVTLKP